jgi:hypothetical protein
MALHASVLVEVGTNRVPVRVLLVQALPLGDALEAGEALAVGRAVELLVAHVLEVVGDGTLHILVGRIAFQHPGAARLLGIGLDIVDLRHGKVEVAKTRRCRALDDAGCYLSMANMGGFALTKQMSK